MLATDKKTELDIGNKARSIKSKFETGELFKDETQHLYEREDKAVFDYGNDLIFKRMALD